MLSNAFALRMVRTETGKKLRKAYEGGVIHHGFNEHRVSEPRYDGCSNSLTTVQKDNLILCYENEKVDAGVIRICATRGRDKTNPGYRGPANTNFVQRLELGGGRHQTP